MKDLDILSLSAKPPGDIQEASKVSTQHCIRTRLRNLPALVADDAPGNIGILDTEKTPEAATDIAVLDLAQCQTFNAGQQRPRLFLDTEFPKAGTGIVVGTDSRVGNIIQAETKFFCQKTRQFPGFVSEVLGAPCPLHVMPKEHGILVNQRVGTGTRGYNHIIIRIERLNHIFGDVHRSGSVTTIQRRLATATLLTRNADTAPGPLKQSHRSKRHLRAHQVSKTGNK
jgi:hypothetical protein